jgi:hypothetical protein
VPTMPACENNWGTVTTAITDRASFFQPSIYSLRIVLLCATHATITAPGSMSTIH